MSTEVPGAPVAALEVFVDVLSQSDASETTDAFYGGLCQAICRLAGMERAILFRYDGAMRRVRAAGSHGIPLELFAEERFSAETAPLARRSLEEDRVLEVFADHATHLPPKYVELLRPEQVVCIPMAAAGRWVGVIVGDRAAGAPRLDDADRDLLWTLGKAAALAAVARIATSQSERAAQLEHRIDLAREVHDKVIQRLFGVSLALAGEGALSAEARRRCADEVQLALGELRATLQRPLGRAPRSSRTTLGEELERLAREYADLQIAIAEGDPGQVPQRLESIVQSVLDEAVRNAHKHAHPTRIAVALRRAGGAFVMEVVNDGVAHHRRGPTGMGLRLVAFEALQSGGIVEYGPGDGAGLWRVKLVVPDDPA
ncbi:MAG: GAF domain-containing protein [Solirubrobacterales bacterium]